MRIEPRAQLGDPERGFDDYVLDPPADAAEAPVAFSTLLEEAPKDESIDEKTGEPKHPAVIWASTALFVVASIFAFGCYWFYWWRAIHMGTFAHSANLIAWLDPRPGSAGSIVAVCILAAVGCLVSAAPAVTGYNAWRGNRWCRCAGVVAVGITVLCILFFPLAMVATALTAIAAGLLWLPAAGKYFDAWDEFNDPAAEPIELPENVAYGRIKNILF